MLVLAKLPLHYRSSDSSTQAAVRFYPALAQQYAHLAPLLSLLVWELRGPGP